jgi:integrase/recombinase XerD
MAGGGAVKKITSGPFSKIISRHLELRHSLGYKLKYSEVILKDFDIFVSKHFPDAIIVTRPMVSEYLATKSNLKLSTQYVTLTVLRQFCRFLFQINPESYIPGTGLLPALRYDFQPHIYTPMEVRDLIELSKKLRPVTSLRPHTYATIIGLLWVSGLRIGEALRLNVQDVDWETGVLHIERTKFFKSRLVPLTVSTVNALKRYAEKRKQLGHRQGPTDPLFVNTRGRRYAYRTVSATFHDLTCQLDLKSSQGRNPRLHDFRHSFATRCLARFYNEKEDPTLGLPVLATYLGHANIACTTIYLHPSDGVLLNAGLQFQQYVSQKGDTR